MTTVDWSDVQALVRNGYGRHYFHSIHAVLTITEAEAARSWLGDNLEDIADVDQALQREQDRRDNPDAELPPNPLGIAFTASGLSKLGLSERTMLRFPEAFAEGMAPSRTDVEISRRSGILGDIEANDPRHWEWGGHSAEGVQENRADVLLMIFGWDPERIAGKLDKILADSKMQLVAPGARVQTYLERPDTKRRGGQDATPIEHFGYRDSISQPVIEGTRRDRQSTDRQRRLHRVEAGEFVLGYRNARQLTAPVIEVAPEDDPSGLLPLREGKRDFSVNGTYLVVRKLEQNVAAFNDLTGRIAGCGATSSTGGGSQEDAAALIMGRYRDGRPLVAEHGIQDPGSSEDPLNTFGYHHADAAGLICPISAHTRRANPRDCLPPGPAKSLELSKRHRILRRSRLYGPWEDNTRFDIRADRGRGLMFICLNSDITRQFEFIQKTWINNPNFGRRTRETDPVIGTIPAGDVTLTLPSRPGPISIPLHEQIVTVKGGGYFFMPGRRALRFLAELRRAG